MSFSMILKCSDEILYTLNLLFATSLHRIPLYIKDKLYNARVLKVDNIDDLINPGGNNNDDLKLQLIDIVNANTIISNKNKIELHKFILDKY